MTWNKFMDEKASRCGRTDRHDILQVGELTNAASTFQRLGIALNRVDMSAEVP